MIFKIALLFSLFAAFEAKKLKFDEIPGQLYVQKTTGKELDHVEIWCFKTRDGKQGIYCKEVYNPLHKPEKSTKFGIYVHNNTGAFYQTTSPEDGKVIEDPKGNTLYAEGYGEYNLVKKFTLKDKNGQTIYVKCTSATSDLDDEDGGFIKKHCTEKCLRDVDQSVSSRK